MMPKRLVFILCLLLTVGTFAVPKLAAQTTGQQTVDPNWTPLQTAATTTGDGKNLVVRTSGAAIVQVSGTNTGLAITPQGLGAAGQWDTITVIKYGDATETKLTSITVAGKYFVPCAGIEAIKMTIAAISSGSVTVVGRTIPAIAKAGIGGGGGGGSGGDFSGPGSSTANAIVRFSGTGGKTGKNSPVTVSDAGDMVGVGGIVGSGTFESTIATGYLLTGPSQDGIFRPSTGNLTFPNSNIGIKTSGAPSAELEVNGAIKSGTITVGPSQVVNWTAGGGIFGNATTGALTGTVRLFGGTGIALNFGGDSASFPSIKRSATGLIVRLADDSANAPFTTGVLTVGAGIAVTNIRHGITAALSSGVIVVTDTGATANTRYFFTAHSLGTVSIPSTYYVSSRSAGASFTVTASVLTDTSTLDWIALEP